MEADINEYLQGAKLDIREKCLLAQDILRFVSPLSSFTILHKVLALNFLIIHRT